MTQVILEVTIENVIYAVYCSYSDKSGVTMVIVILTFSSKHSHNKPAPKQPNICTCVAVKLFYFHIWNFSLWSKLTNFTSYYGAVIFFYNN